MGRNTYARPNVSENGLGDLDGYVRLFVANLPYVTNDVELCELFQRAGEVRDALS